MQKIVVVLDVDGVLINSLPGLYKVFENFLQKYNAKADWALFNSYNGRKLEEIIQDLIQRFSIKTSAQELLYEYHRQMETVYENAELADGAFRFLTYCQANSVPVALASGAKRAHIDFIIEKFGLKDLIDFSVAGDEVKLAKPDPEMYLRIKERYGEGNYLAIDDSALGVKAASDSGMPAYLFASSENSRNSESIYSFVEIAALLSRQILESDSCIQVNNCQMETIARQFEETEQADLFWVAETKKNPRLHNGKCLLLSEFHIEEKTLYLKVIETSYKNYLFRRKSAFILPIGVSGLVRDASDRILLGKRSQSMSHYPGCIELVPSGNLSPGNTALEQVLAELEEEAGIPVSLVKSCDQKAALFESKHGFVDLCFEMRLESGAECRANPEEYEWIRFVDKAQAIALMRDNPVITSQRILQHLT